MGIYLSFYLLVVILFLGYFGFVLFIGHSSHRILRLHGQFLPLTTSVSSGLMAQTDFKKNQKDDATPTKIVKTVYFKIIRDVYRLIDLLSSLQ